MDLCKLPKAKKTTIENVDPSDIRQEMDTINRALVSVLRARRQDSDFTQAQIGKAFDVSEDVIANIEAMRRPAFFAQAIVWARLGGMECEEFFESFLFNYRKMRSRRP